MDVFNPHPGVKVFQRYEFEMGKIPRCRPVCFCFFLRSIVSDILFVFLRFCLADLMRRSDLLYLSLNSINTKWPFCLLCMLCWERNMYPL
jgi:hypothetical protein